MPFINTVTNIDISDEKETEIKNRLGSAIEILGKSESWLMISFNKNSDMYFKGKSAPMAFVDISVFGSPSEEQCEKMTQAVCSILNGELNIPADMIYVKFSGTNLWGWNNMMF